MPRSEEEIAARMKYLEELIVRLENKETIDVETLLGHELQTLKQLCEEKIARDESKKVIRKEEKGLKSRYYLSDGSVYVVKGRNYRYLYDSSSKIVTYEFENGQIERTFANGIKEIRRPDGSIIIKDGQAECDKFPCS